MADFKKILIRYNTFNALLAMIETVEIAARFPALIPIGGSLRKRLEKIKKLDFSTGRDKNSEVKKEMRYKLATTANCISCGVYSYAQANGMVSLRNAVKYSFSDFYRPVEATMIGRCRQVINAVKKVKNPEHYALTAAVIEKFEEELKKYIEFMPKPVLKVKQHARMYRQVEHLLDQCLHIIQEQLDPLMTIIGCTDAKLSRDYFIWRKINKPSGRKRKYVKKKTAGQQNTVNAKPATAKSIVENTITKQPFTQIISETA